MTALVHHQTDNNGPGLIEVNLVESDKVHIGKNRRLEWIAVNLLAFTCREAFRKGYHTIVFFIPKTNLISHWIEKYGFTHIGTGLSLEITRPKQ